MEKALILVEYALQYNVDMIVITTHFWSSLISCKNFTDFCKMQIKWEVLNTNRNIESIG